MSKRGWLCPSELPGGLIAIEIYLPDNDLLIANWKGAMVALSEPWNWEQTGTATAEEVAQVWLELNIENFKLSACQ